ncbi:MAG: hypothetical protein NXI27_27955 [Alphaproteobacteria bacterium]|nr:hypothetical protein [Alphaproteobacteria bacterium]
MDLQALTFVKLTEHQTIAFDPGKEDDYYDAAVDMTRLARAPHKVLSRAARLLRAIRTIGRWPQERVGKLKVTTG